MIRRLLAPTAGVVLIGLVLWQVGWRDRVLDRSGKKHVGRIEAREGDDVLLRVDGEVRRITKPSATREGLLTAFARLGDHPGRAAIGLLLHLLGLLAVFFRWSVLLRGADLAMPLRQVIRLSWVGQFFGVVLPGGVGTGDVIRAVYAAREHPGRRARAVVTVFVDRVIGLVVLCTLATLAVVVSPRLVAFDRVRVVVLVILSGAVATAIVLFSKRVRDTLRLTKLLRRLPFQQVIQECEAAVTVYGSRPGTLALTAACAVVAQVLMLAAFYFYAGALGSWLTLLAVGAAIPVAQILSAIPGLPGGWGIGDYAYLTFLPAAGVAPATAVALSFTYRVLHTLLSAPGALMLGRGKDRIHVPEESNPLALET